MGTKIKCLQCGDIVEGDRRGHLISCKCGACYIDETPDYYRIGGNYDKVALIDEEGKETILSETIPKDVPVVNKPIITRREWLSKMSDEDLANFIINELPYVYINYTNSVSGLTKWFKEEIEEE